MSQYWEYYQRAGTLSRGCIRVKTEKKIKRNNVRCNRDLDLTQADKMIFLCTECVSRESSRRLLASATTVAVSASAVDATAVNAAAMDATSATTSFAVSATSATPSADEVVAKVACETLNHLGTVKHPTATRNGTNQPHMGASGTALR